jgi:MarR family transcriptional regulator, temperature-dependent positive regulator of motility
VTVSDGNNDKPDAVPGAVDEALSRDLAPEGAVFDAETDFVLHELPGHLIRRLQQAAVSLFMAQVDAGGFDLTPVQFAALTGIKAYPGLDQASLAGLIAYDRATIGGVIDRLESKGLIRRTASPHDRRSRQLHIEPAGEQLLGEAAPAVQHAQDLILDPLNREERLIFMLLLSKLVRSNNERSRVPMRPISSPSHKRDEVGGSGLIRS